MFFIVSSTNSEHSIQLKQERPISKDRQISGLYQHTTDQTSKTAGLGRCDARKIPAATMYGPYHRQSHGNVLRITTGHQTDSCCIIRKPEMVTSVAPDTSTAGKDAVLVSEHHVQLLAPGKLPSTSNR